MVVDVDMKTIVASIAVVLAPLTANALTVNTVAQDAAAWNKVNTTQTVAMPTGSTWTSAPVKMPDAYFPQIDPCVSFCSPFDPGIFGTGSNIGATPLANWQDLPFWATWQQADGSNTNVLSFGKAQNEFRMLWGSMDNGNLLEFLLNGTVVGSLTGAQLPGVTVGNPGQGAALIRVFGLSYDQVRFSSTSGAFEFSNVQASPVPLPLPVAGLAAALGALTFFRRRRATA